MLKYGNQKLIKKRLKIVQIIYDMKNLCRNISLSENFFVDVLPAHENE